MDEKINKAGNKNKLHGLIVFGLLIVFFVTLLYLFMK